MQTAPRRRRTRPQARPISPRISLGRLCAILAIGALVGASAGLLSARRERQDPAGPSAVVAATASAQALVATAEREVIAQPPPGPTPDLEALADQRMREAVLGPFAGLSGRLGIAASDLGSGRTVLLNEQDSFEAASLYKLPVMYEVFRQRETGGLRFGEELTIGPEDAAFDLGTLFWPIGTRITVGTALERMITISDNSSAVMLTQLVRAQRINESMLALGLRQTAIERDHLSTSALDMLRLLELLARGRAVDGPTSGEMIRLMARQEVRNRIPALLPPEATVANKTGDWGGAAHDVGLIYGPRVTLALVFLSEDIADREAVYAAMARAARELDDLVNDPGVATRPYPPAPRLW